MPLKLVVMETNTRRNIAAFMAFGTKGDVYPIAAIAAAFARDQKQYHVVLITHLDHENLNSHLAEQNVEYAPISSPPALSFRQNHDTAADPSFAQQKELLTKQHRQQCYSVVERVFGDGPSMEGDFILINFFALEGWSFAELFQVPCIVAAPYVVPYSAPSSFERQFKKEHFLLYKYLKTAPSHKVSWKDVTHWMWPLFTEYWGSWRCSDLNLSPCPFTDPVTFLPWHDRLPSPLLLYGFSKEVVECPDYWPSNVRVCGFWFVPDDWQFSCKKCMSTIISTKHVCAAHVPMQSFLESKTLLSPIFIGLSSVGSMGFFKNPPAFLRVLENVLEITSYRFILFTAGYGPLEDAIHAVAVERSASLTVPYRRLNNDCVTLFNARLFCFSGAVPYNWLLRKCIAAIHHGGSGTTAAALSAGIPQVVCPFMLDQFYWAERMFWLGVAPQPLKTENLLPEQNDDKTVLEAASVMSSALHYALSPRVKARAEEICQSISLENGVSEAVGNIKRVLLRGRD